MNLSTALTLVVFALSSVAFGAPKPPANTDNFWEILVSPQFATTEISSLFWRTHQAGDAIEVYDACDDKNKLGNAQKKEDGWIITQNGKAAFSVTVHGSELTLKLPDAKEYGVGYRIRPVKCSKGQPEKTFRVQAVAGERTFAQVSGDATHVEAARDMTLLPVPLIPPFIVPQANSTQYLPDGSSVACSYTPVVKITPRSLTNMPTLGHLDKVWPGALLQGKFYMLGQFEPITIARKSGTIILAGANLPGEESAYSIEVDNMSDKAVHDSVQALVAQKALSVEADVSTRTEVVFNQQHLAYLLNSDIRFLNEVGSKLLIDPTSGDNYVLFNFKQVYFTASLRDPETAYDVFEDGNNIKDPNNQIGASNVPLLVKSVGYGRNLFFLVASKYPANILVQALNSAGEGQDGGSVNYGGKLVSYLEVLQGSKVTFLLQGSEGIPGLGTSGSINGAATPIFQTIKKLVAGLKMERVNDFNKVTPVNYSLSYLTSRGTASMGFGAAYNVKYCEINDKKNPSFWLNIAHIDDEATVRMLGPGGLNQVIYKGSSVPVSINLGDYLDKKHLNETHTLQVDLYNVGGPSGFDFQFGEETYGATPSIKGLEGDKEIMVPASNRDTIPLIKKATGWWVGARTPYKIEFNPTSGAVKVLAPHF